MLSFMRISIPNMKSWTKLFRTNCSLSSNYLRLSDQLGRPRVDTLNGSEHAKMKELRFDAAGGVWRFAFAFDPRRNAIVLCGGDKSGGSEKKFYKGLTQKAEARFSAHVARLKEQQKKGKKS